MNTPQRLASALDITPKQAQLLLMLDRWDGDMPPDAEDVLGAHGAAMDAIVRGLMKRGLIADGAWGTLTISDEARTSIDAARAKQVQP